LFIIALKNGEAWAVKYYLSPKGKSRGYHKYLEEDKDPVDNRENQSANVDWRRIPIEKRRKMVEWMEEAKVTS